MSMPCKSLFSTVWSYYATQLSTMFCKPKACYKQTKQKLMTPVKEVNWNSRPENTKTTSDRLQKKIHRTLSEILALS